MANVDALNSLLAGHSVWNDYLAYTTEEIDLTFADLRDTDLRSRKIEGCNLSGAQLRNANLDHAVVRNCNLLGADLTDASLVRCNLENLDLQNVIASGIVIRDSLIVNVDLTKSNLSSATFSSTEFRNCTFCDIHNNGLVLSSCNLKSCTFTDLTLSCLWLHNCMVSDCAFLNWNIDNLQILNTIIESSNINRIISNTGQVKYSRFIKCYIEKIDIGSSIILCQNLDFSQSLLVRTDLGLLGLNTATMLKTSIAFCKWPKQQGFVTPTGKYISSPFLLTQPVQDLLGVPPILRREIADAQYLVKKISSCSKFSRPFMRIWGLCTGFGQSLFRLFLSTFGLITCSTLLLLATRNQLFGTKPNFGLLIRTARESFDAFFAFTNVPDSSSSIELLIIILTRLSGFLVLGFWISIVSTKLSRLGSE